MFLFGIVFKFRCDFEFSGFLRFCVGCWICIIFWIMVRFLVSFTVCYRILELLKMCEIFGFCCINCCIFGCFEKNCFMRFVLDRSCWMVGFFSICVMYFGLLIFRFCICILSVLGFIKRVDFNGVGFILVGWNILLLFFVVFLFWW